MKTPFLYRHSRGFTLIELLVVIAIILTLAGISMMVVNGVQEKAKKLDAKNDCNGLVTGIDNYVRDQGRIPVAWSAAHLKSKSKNDQVQVTTAPRDDSYLMAILTNNLSSSNKKLNAKKTAYFNSKAAEDEGVPGLFAGGPDEASLIDPWGNAYHIIMNANPDDRTPAVYVGKRRITQNFVAFSLGLDFLGDKENPDLSNTEDYVTSW